MNSQAQEHQTFTIERTYPNCCDHVWSAWSSLEKKKAWFGDDLSRSDFAPGGQESGEFETELGVHANETRYFEIAEGERIIFAYSMTLNGRVHTVSLATVLFEDEGGGTKLTYTEQMCVIAPSEGLAGRKEGWEGLLQSLSESLLDETRAKAS